LHTIIDSVAKSFQYIHPVMKVKTIP